MGPYGKIVTTWEYKCDDHAAQNVAIETTKLHLDKLVSNLEASMKTIKRNVTVE